MPPAGLAAAATSDGNTAYSATHTAAGRAAAAGRVGHPEADLSCPVPFGRRDVLQRGRRRVRLLRKIVGRLPANRWFVQRRCR